MVTTKSSSQAGGLFGRGRAAVLGLLLLRPDERFHLRQVSRLSGQGLGAVQRELKALTGMCILQREQSGRQVYFRANRQSPLFDELQGLVMKTSGIVGVLRAALVPLTERIKVALVFGSVARGAMNSESDVDLLILSDNLSVRDLASLVRQAGQAIGREINVNLYRPGEWAKRVSEQHALAESILKNPRLFLIGDDHELH